MWAAMKVVRSGFSRCNTRLWPGSTRLVSSGCLQGPCSSQQTAGSAGSWFAPRMSIRMSIFCILLTLRNLAKPLQTTNEARAHCCFACFRRILWHFGDRGVCWTFVGSIGWLRWPTSTWRLLTCRMHLVCFWQRETNNVWDRSFKNRKHALQKRIDLHLSAAITS